MTEKTKFSADELQMFRLLIEQKLEKSYKDLDYLRSQIEDLSETMEGDNDWQEDGSAKELEMLFTMQSRTRQYNNDLLGALRRIENGTFGICVITGELIDPRRLMAVPTTTKSLQAKMGSPVRPTEKDEEDEPKKTSSGPKIFSRVIKPLKKKAEETTQPDDFELDEDFEDEETEDHFEEDELLEDFDEQVDTHDSEFENEST